MDDIIKAIDIDDEFEKESNAFICKFATHAFNEGFVAYSYTSNIKFYCEDTSELTSGKNVKYYTLTSNDWSLSKSEKAGFLTTYDITSLDFSVDNRMEYTKYSYVFSNHNWDTTRYIFKIYNNAIYVKKNKEDDYVKKFTIVSIKEDELRLKEINGVFRN